MALWLVGCHQRGGTCHHSFFGRTSNRGRSIKKWKHKEAGDCHVILFLSTTFGPWCHFPRIGSPFLRNGYLNSSMGSMVKSNIIRHCKVYVNSLYPCTSDHWRHENSSNGHQNCISQWWPWRGDLHGTTPRIHTRRRTSCV